MGQIGKPIREIQVEPLTIPVPQRQQPAPLQPVQTPTPEQVPVPV